MLVMVDKTATLAYNIAEINATNRKSRAEYAPQRGNVTG